MIDCPHIERTHALADGELSAADAEAAREHLATCEICQAELAEALQLDAAMAERAARAPRAKGADVISLAWYRRRKVQVAAVAVAAAAGIAVYIALPKRTDVPAEHRAPQLALAEHRALEPRLSWSGAAAYRPYDVPRGDAAHETVSMTTLGQLEEAGDVHGVGVLALLDGDRRQAQTYLDKARDSADVIADRAALALLDAHPERALALADQALAIQPGHPGATWNRALALRDLGLPRAAAAAFREVAAKAEPGWAAEAEARAKQLDTETDARRDRANRVNAAGAQLVETGAGITPDDARAELGLARLWLYDAIRAAESADRLASLQPLADAIDAADHTDAMAAAIARAKAHLQPRLAARYGAIVAAIARRDVAHLPQGAERAAFLAELRKAHADDLLIGALVRLAPDFRTVDAAELPEFAKLTAASPDPWMQLLGLEQQATAALRASDFPRAEALLVTARARCAQGGPLLRCARVDQFSIDLYLQTQRLPEARALLDAAWKRARAAGAWFEDLVLLPQLAQLAVFSDDTAGSSLPLARAYVEESDSRHAEYDPPGAQCHGTLWGRTQIATVLVNQLRLADAKRALPAEPACDRPTPDALAANLFVRAQVLRDAGTPAELATFRTDAAALRAMPGVTAAALAIADVSEGRVLVDRDAARALLQHAIASAHAAPGDAALRKTAAYAYAVLVLDDAKRGDGAAALGAIAEEQHLEPPAACALGLAVDGRRRAAVARGPSGAFTVHYDEARTSPKIDAAALVTPDVTAALAGCASVDVLARPPIDGTPRIFGDAIAWRYRVPRAHPLSAAPPMAAAKPLVVANVEPPAALELPRLQTWSAAGDSGATLGGPDATPARVLAAIGSASDVVIHAHGLVDLAAPDASFLALSPDADGHFALTAGAVRAAHFATSPLVVLAACRASQAAPVFHEAWSLPAAFVFAGARAVIASAAPIPDADAAAFFDDVRARAAGGAPVAVALRDARAAWLAARKGEWVRDVMVFE